MTIPSIFPILLLVTTVAAREEASLPPSALAQSSNSIRGSRIAVSITASGSINRVYIAREHAIQCFESNLQGPIWTSAVSKGSVDVGPVLVGNTVVYVSDDMSTVKGLSAASGMIKWTAHIQTAHLAGNRKILFLATSTGMGVEALDAETGKRKWKYEPGGRGSIYQLFYADGRIYTDAYVLDASTGHIITKNSSDAQVITSNATNVFRAMSDGDIDATPRGTNDTSWKIRYHPNAVPVALAANGLGVYFVGYNRMPFIAHVGVLQAFHTIDGHQVWQRPLTSSNGLQPEPISSDRENLYLFVPEENSRTQLSSISGATGKIIWTRSIPGKVEGPPVAVGRYLIFTEGPDVLYEVNKKSGEVVMRSELHK